MAALCAPGCAPGHCFYSMLLDNWLKNNGFYSASLGTVQLLIVLLQYYYGINTVLFWYYYCIITVLLEYYFNTVLIQYYY